MKIVSPNQRPSCGKKPGSVPQPLAVVGSCTQQTKQALSKLPLIQNTTQFKNSEPSDGNGPYIPPYQLANQNGIISTYEAGSGGAPDCSPYNSGCPDPCYVCGDFGMTNNNDPCLGQTFDPSDIKPCGPGETRIDLGNGYFNCFSQSKTEKVSYSKCQNLGWKSHAAHKAFNGRPSYHDSEAVQEPSYFDWCFACAYTPPYPTPSHQHYLSVEASTDKTIHTDTYTKTGTVTGTATCTDAQGNPFTVDIVHFSVTLQNTCDCSDNASNNVVNDKFGNILSVSPFSGSSGGSCGCDEEDAFNRLGMADSDITSIGTIYFNEVASAGAAFGQPIVSGGGTSWTLEYHVTQTMCFQACTDSGPVDQIAETIAVDIDAGTLEIVQYGYHYPQDYSTDNFCLIWAVLSHRVWNFGGEGSTAFSYTEADNYWSDSFTVNSSTSIQIAGSLGKPYSATDVRNDIKTLLKQWDMGNDAQMPWRTDLNKSIVPVVYYQEVANNIPVISSIETTNNIYGKLLGTPAPIGTDQIWDVEHFNWCACNSTTNPGNILPYIRTFGQTSEAIGTPCATKWVDNFQATNLPDEACILYNQFVRTDGTPILDENVLWAKTYAEVIFPKRSFDYERFPSGCGADRFQVSGSPFIGDDAIYTGLSLASCVASATGNSLTLEPSGPPSPITNGQYVWVCGVSDELDGAWQASVADAGYTINLNHQKYSASLNPTPPVLDCGTGIVGPLRWQNFQAHICGRISIDNVSSTKPAVCFLSEPSYLCDGDTVIISGSVGMPQLNGTWIVDVADTGSVQVTLRGSDGTTGSYVPSAAIYTPFTTDYRYEDTQPKGDYTTIEWNYNYRQLDEFTRLTNQNIALSGQFGCDSLTPCPNPGVPPFPRPNQGACGMDSNLVTVPNKTSCLVATPCQPTVAYYSPNEENFGTASVVVASRNHGFGLDNFQLDSRDGARWQAVIKQSMQDPLWQAPPCPCSADEGTDPVSFDCNFFWQEDTGDCLGDDPIDNIKYFPHIDQFEARTEVPTGAPQPPAGVSLGCLDTDKFTDPNNCPPGNICQPPFTDMSQFTAGVGGSPGDNICPAIAQFPYAFPWATWSAECFCVKSDGRFADEYSQNILNCFNQLIPPP